MKVMNGQKFKVEEPRNETYCAAREISIPCIKAQRLTTRLRDKEWRRYGVTLLAGKVMGVGLTLIVMAAVHRHFLHKSFSRR